jgi:predicted DNA-binding transcriptional regulator AlpA
MFENDFLNDRQLAEILGISIQSLRNKISSSENLPDRVQLPGCRKRLWPTKKVYQWLEMYTVSSIENKSLIRRAIKR